MKLTALRLHNVRRFAQRGVAIEGIGDGVNVLCAANEFGKSTSFAALHALFFQPHGGAPKEVTRLRPYSGGAPLVEADIATADGRYRITKRFISGKRASVTDLGTGRLVAQADEAEAFIAGLIGGGAAGPAGLLWVRQGITGVEEREKKEEEGERRVRESLLASVQGEVEAVTGGRRMAAIIEAVGDELDLLVTPKDARPKAGSGYDAAVKERDRLEAEEARLAADVVSLRDALDERQKAVRRLAEIGSEEGRDRRRRDVDHATEAFDHARAHGDALKAATAEAGHARSRRDAAAAALGDYRKALAEAAATAEALGRAQADRDDARARRAAAAAEADAAARAVETAEAAERAARAALDRFEAARAARAAAAELDTLRRRLVDAEALRERHEAAEAKLATLTLPKNAAEDLHQLDVTIGLLEATEAERRPTLTVTYEPGAEGRISLDGAALAGGEPRGFDDRAQIEIAGVGTLHVRTGRAAPADGALAKAVEKRRALLASLGVADTDAARRREAEAREVAAARDRLALQFAHAAPDGLPKLRTAVVAAEARAAAEPADAAAEGDGTALRATLDDAARAVAAARLALREHGPRRAALEDAYVAAERAVAGLGADSARLELRLGPVEARADAERRLAGEFAEAEEVAERAEAEAARLARAAPDIESAKAALARARSAETAAAGEIKTLEIRLADLNGLIRARSDDAVEEAWQEARDALAAARERVARYRTEVAVLTRLRGALEAARAAARDLYLAPVIAELKPLLNLLFDDVAIVFDEKTLLPQSIRRNGQEEEVDRLSGGMREQLSILTRLAFARLLARDGRPAPVILDDALVYSDDDRIEKMFDALHRQARDQQIIVFSCRQRAFARLGGTVLTMTPWQPDLG